MTANRFLTRSIAFRRTISRRRWRVIGSVLVDREMLAAVGEIVRPARFLRARSRDDLRRAPRSLRSRRAARQNHRRARSFAGATLLERVGGLSYISALMDTVQSAGVGALLCDHRSREVGPALADSRRHGDHAARLRRRRRRCRSARPLGAARLYDRRAPRRYRVHAGQPADERCVRSYRPALPYARRSHRTHRRASTTSTR